MRALPPNTLKPKMLSGNFLILLMGLWRQLKSASTAAPNDQEMRFWFCGKCTHEEVQRAIIALNGNDMVGGNVGGKRRRPF